MFKTAFDFAKSLIEKELFIDIGPSDITSDLLFDTEELCSAYIMSKSEGILCGIKFARFVFKSLDPEMKFTILIQDGEKIHKGDIIAEISAKTRAVLSAERTALNLLQHLSAIATKTNAAIKSLNNAHIKILDTRKTVPGLRYLQKYAVVTGGGTNHRMGLYDNILIKNNHLNSYSIKNAVEKLRKLSDKHKIEVETRNISEVKEALLAKADIIMLDNFSISQTKKAVNLINQKAKIEISGGIKIKDLKKYRNLKVDYISMGCLTHSVEALDICLRIKNKISGT
jgi:nicotinate-nucleotide pyrophosphorylase (carboxylating)